MPKLTARQAQDIRNGYSEGFFAASHGDKALDGKMPSPEFAAGAKAGLRDGALSPRLLKDDREMAIAAVVSRLTRGS